MITPFNAKKLIQATKPKNKRKQKYHISRLAQCKRLHKWLQKKTITTFEGRKFLDIIAVAARIYDLRHEQNLNIVTHWAIEISDQGVKHRIAKYVLMQGKYKESSGD